MNAGYLFLVTRKANHFDDYYMDSLQIEGLFTTESRANQRVRECKERDERIFNDPWLEDYQKNYIYTYSVTEMPLDLPFKDNEYKQYPSAWYEE